MRVVEEMKALLMEKPVLIETQMRCPFCLIPELHEDERGVFRMFREEIFKTQGMSFHLAQVNLSSNSRRDALLGMDDHLKLFEGDKIMNYNGFINCIKSL